MNDLYKNYEGLLDSLDPAYRPNLFLHVCCCPCSSHIILKLYNKFNLYLVFYNPNIDTKEEFDKRLTELDRFLTMISSEYNINREIPIVYRDYNHDEFLSCVKGLEHEKEGGKRCDKCFELRLSKAIEISIAYIQDNCIDGKSYFCTSLTTSPNKNANLIFDIGDSLCKEKGFPISYLPSDFKKKDGYLDSIKLCEKYNIYRQNYCGCEYSKGL